MQKIFLFFLSLLSLSSFAGANSGLQGFHFNHKDWEIACDNTGTCRMAGYMPESYREEEYGGRTAGSIYFEREAGKTALKGSGRIFIEGKDKLLPLSLWLDDSSLGSLEVTDEAPDYEFVFTPEQTEKLLAALVGSPKIEIRGTNIRWQISAEGATAAMLKMDEFQQRLDTPTALVRKGKNNLPILQPQPLPKIKHVKPIGTNVEGWEITDNHPEYKRLLSLIKSKIDTDQGCFGLYDERAIGWAGVIEVYPLATDRKLISSLCYMAAYNFSMVYLLTDKDEKEVFWHSTDYNGFDGGVLSGSYKGRGISDCIDYKESVWNGETFVLSQEYTTGMCREFPGGAWILPTFVSDVEKADK